MADSYLLGDAIKIHLQSPSWIYQQASGIMSSWFLGLGNE